jgi:hypothetical protein
VGLIRFDIGFAKPAIDTEIFYTVMGSADPDETTALFDDLVSMFVGLKANVSDGLEFKFSYPLRRTAFSKSPRISLRVSASPREISFPKNYPHIH